MPSNRALQRLRALFRSVLWRNPQQADTGQIDSSNNPLPNPTDGLEPGEIYVRVGGSRAETVALNGIVNDGISNIPVIVGIGRFSKRLEIIDVDRERARLRFGDAISSLWAQPAGDLSRTTTRGRNFKPGRVKVSSGLTLVAHDFFYKDSADAIKLWTEASGTVTLTAPAASGGTDTERWTVIALNPDATTPALVAIDGTAQLTTLPSPLQIADIASIAITDGYIPLAAVKLTTGDTTPGEAQFVDFRLYFEKDGAVSGMTSFTLAGDSGSSQTISNGNTLTVAGGTGIDTVAGATDAVTVAIDSTVATLTGAQTLTNKTLTAPVIADFTNAGHDHLDAGDGGALSAAAIASGTLDNARVNWASPGAIGGTTPNSAAFTTLSASGAVTLNGGLTTTAANVTFERDGANLIHILDAFGAIPITLYRRANGTKASKSATLANIALGVIGARGYGATGYTADNKAQISFFTSQDWTDANQGTYIKLSVTADNTAAVADVLFIEQNRSLTLKNATAAPGTPTAGIALYASSGEFRVKDDAGNVTLLSSHFPTLIDTSERWTDYIHHEENALLGLTTEVDILGAVEALETLTGKKFIHQQFTTPSEVWDETEAAHEQRALSEYRRAQETYQTALAAYEATPEAKRGDMTAPIAPDAGAYTYEKRPIPPTLAARLARKSQLGDTSLGVL